MAKETIELKLKSNKQEYRAIPRKKRFEIYEKLLEKYEEYCAASLTCKTGEGMCCVLDLLYDIERESGLKRRSNYGACSYIAGVYVIFDGGLPEIYDEYKIAQKKYPKRGSKCAWESIRERRDVLKKIIQNKREKMRFIKPFSSFKYCMDYRNSTKNMWKMALRDPAYLMIWAINLSLLGYTIYLLTSL